MTYEDPRNLTWDTSPLLSLKHMTETSHRAGFSWRTRIFDDPTWDTSSSVPLTQNVFSTDRMSWFCVSHWPIHTLCATSRPCGSRRSNTSVLGPLWCWSGASWICDMPIWMQWTAHVAPWLSKSPLRVCLCIQKICVFRTSSYQTVGLMVCLQGFPLTRHPCQYKPTEKVAALQFSAVMTRGHWCPSQAYIC